MEDMDLDELMDGPAQGTSRPTRFAPKGANLKLRPKTEPSQNESNSVPLPIKEELGAKPECSNGTIDMAVNVKDGVKKEETYDMMETEEREAVAELEDEVVREIDVYYNPSVDPNTLLYVLQYPLRPSWRPYELDERCDEVRVKPESAELEIELAVDVNSKNYNSRAESKLMEKQILTSAWNPPPSSGYAVGVLDGNQLHLNPVHAVVQLRPSMQHLNSKEYKRKANASNDVEKLVKAEESSGALKKMSKPAVQIKDSGEGWVPLKYHGARSGIVSRYLQNMLAGECSAIHFSMSSYDYLDSLCPVASIVSFRSKVPPRRSLLTLPLKERFKTWLLEGPPVQRFDALKYLAPAESVEEVLGVLREHARIVQGLWVPKSTLVYGTDQGVELSARDYILLLFSKNVLINNSQLPRNPHLAKAMKDVLNVLAVERPAFNDWKLKELPDMNFIKLYPSLVKEEEEEWECLEKKFNGFLEAKRGKLPEKSNTINNPTISKSSNKVSTRTASGASSRSAISEEDREAIMKSLQRLFKNLKVCSFQQISQRLRDIAVSESNRSTTFAREAKAAADSIDKFPDGLQAIIGQVAVNIHGVCVPKSSPDNSEYDPFRQVVIDLYLAEGPNAKLKKATILEAAKVKLGREVPQNEFKKVLQELCLSQDSAWVLRSGDGNPKHQV